MSLFINLLIKAQMPEILLHEKIINEFTTRTTKASMIGYYNTTFDAAIKYIQKDALKNENEKIKNEIREIKFKEKENFINCIRNYNKRNNLNINNTSNFSENSFGNLINSEIYD